jgi:aminoglycoside phosphotransferase (APT) family kinase protein
VILSPDTRAPAVMGPIISDAFPDLTTPRPRLLFAGEEFDTWGAGDVVMKFPRSERDARRLSIEIAVHPLIAERLGKLVPAIVGVAEPSERFPFPSVAYTSARGRQGQTIEGPIIQPKPWARTTLARELAEALTRLHTTPMRSVKAAGVEVRPVVLDPQVDVGEDAIAWARRVAGDAVDAFLSDPLPMDARDAATGVLCHADLKGEHLFVSEDGTRLTAIIDWADAAIADPAADLAGLAIWLGPGFVRQVLRTYEGPADEGTYHRAVFLARAGLLGYLDEQLTGDAEPAPVAMLDAQLRAVFREDAPARR